MRPVLFAIPLFIVVASALAGTPALAMSNPANRSVDQWNVTQWTSRDGLPQNSITSIVQTSGGDLWLGTFGGLVRFDGEQFKTTSVGHDVARIENRIVSMHLDRAGDLWLGFMARGIIRVRGSTITHYPTDEGVPRGPIWRIVEDQQGVIWVAGYGLSRFDGDRFRAESIADGATVWSVIADPIEGIHAITSNGLVRIDAHGAGTTEIGETPKHSEWWFIGQEPRTDPWLVKGAQFFDVRMTSPNPAPIKIAPHLVRDSLVDRDGRWWLGAENGLFLAKSGAFDEPPVFDQIRPEIKHVRALYEDTNGLIWVGTDGDGLFRLKPPAHDFVPYSEIIPRPGRRLYLTGDADSVWYIRGAPGPSAVHLTTIGREPTIALGQHGVRQVRAALSGSDGSLWISTLTALVQLRGDKTTTHGHTLPGPITALAEIDGAILCGGRGYVARFESDSSFHIVATPEGAVQRFCNGKDDDLWFITRSTLYHLVGNELTDLGQTTEIPTSLRGLAVAPNGDVWIGSYSGGLMRFRAGQAIHLTSQHGLPDSAISFVAIDDDGTLWAHSNRGVFRLRASEVEDFASGKATRVYCQLFDTGEAHGAQGWFSPDGDLVLPTLDGVVSLNVREQRAMKVANVRFDRVHSNLRSHTPSPTLALAASERDLRVGFSAVALGHTDQLALRYRLDNSKEWHDAHNSRELVLADLSPGEHRIEVAARVGDGPWTIASQPFAIASFFHETAWFRGGLAFCFVAALFFAVRLQLITTERRRIRVSQQVTEAYERERRRIGRELHDDVSQRLAAIAMDTSLTAAAGAGAHRVTESIQDLAADVHRLSRQLHPSLLTDLGLAQAIESECREFSKRTGIATQTKLCDPIPETTDETALALFRILQESLRNMEKHAHAVSAAIELKHTRDGWLMLRVEDAGRGFDLDDHDGGLGLVSMRERAHLVGGRLRVSSRPDRGTTVEVEVPCGLAH